MVKKTILIVDDEKTQLEILSGYLIRKKFKVFTSSSADEAIQIVNNNLIDVVLTDYKMPGKSGIELLDAIRKINPVTEVIIITAYGTIEDAVKAMKLGAYDYITKPIDLNELDIQINRILEHQYLKEENKELKSQLENKYIVSGIIAESESMQKILSIASRAAGSGASVLITGESGTGKELIARAIHNFGSKENKPFIAVNCAAMNENLFESELFGHEKGSFTGADKQRKGRFESADGGTIFLDEIGDIPISIQVKLLRVLQEGEFERVGSSTTLKVDVRVIAATNKNLTEMIKAGKFREDLYYRLNVINIEIPPLRERKEDLIKLLDYFLEKYKNQSFPFKTGFSKEAIDMLMKYDYPGNIRELENIIQRAIILARNDIIMGEDIFLNNEEDSGVNGKNDTLPCILENLEKKLVLESLEKNHGNQSQAARELGISERNLRYRLIKWGFKEKQS